MATSITDSPPVSNGDTGGARIRLDISGMTCASCAARIEKKINRVEGVTATVNYATEQANVRMVSSTVTTEDLIATVASMGYGAALRSSIVDDASERSANRLRLLRLRLIVGAALSIPIVAVSMVPGLQFDRWQWFALAFATPVVLWCGWPFHRATWMNVRHGSTTMDTLISVGTLSAYIWSLYALLFGDAGMRGMKMRFEFAWQRDRTAEHLYFEVASAVIVFLLAGRYFEGRAKVRAGSALRSLLSLGAKQATLIDANGVERVVDIDGLCVGDRFVVRPGEKIATDGVVVEGESSIDASLITGESMPTDVGIGAAVIGATLNADGRIVVRATRVGSETALAQMARLVEDAQSGKAPVQRLADRISVVFVPTVIGLALTTLVAWLWLGRDARSAFTAAVSVLIIACPCALGLATPTALLVGTGRAAQLGIVIKGPEMLESTRRVDTIVFDKTGTITTGRMTLMDTLTFEGLSTDDAVRIAGAAERASEHPIARAISDAAAAQFGTVAAAADFRNHRGLGVGATVDGQSVLIGKAEFLRDNGVDTTSALTHAMEAASESGSTAIALVVAGRVAAVFTVADAIKASSAAAVTKLKQLGLHTILLSGDSEPVARRVASTVGIDDVTADVLPDEKMKHIMNLQAQGRVVAMVGDGVNDAAALAQADLGIAMGTGTDAAIQAADLTLVRGDLLAVVDAIRLSRRTLQTIKVNLFWAFAYNVIALPLAAFGFLNPLIAGAAMALSSVFVVSNSLRLRVA